MSFSAWFQNSGAILEANRAQDAWGRIQHLPTSIIVRRNGTTLPVQTMRIETDSTVTETQDRNVARQGVVIFGVKNHPQDSVPDTDLQRGDRFIHQGMEWLVNLVDASNPGEIQAKAEVIST